MKRNVLLDLISIPLWIAPAVVKGLVFLVGVVVVPFTKPDHPIFGNNEDPVPRAWYRPGQPEWFRDYMWRAWRNGGGNNLRFLFTEPEIDSWYGILNLEPQVRSGVVKSGYRFARAKLYSEYWYMRKIGNEFFEFRLGWKFSGVPGFFFTAQLRKGE